MTVKELIALLEQCDPEAPIYADGCDCIDEASGIDICVDGDQGVLVARQKPQYKPGDRLAGQARAEWQEGEQEATDCAAPLTERSCTIYTPPQDG